MTQSNQFTRRNVVAGAATLASAGLAASQASAAPAPLPAKWDQETDVVVAGGGVAGCMAAIEAAGAGAKVLLLQATPDLGGNSRISSAWIRSVNTRWHKELGIQDTTEAYAKDIIDYGGGTRDEKKAKVIAEVSGKFVDRLMDYGVKISDEKDTANGGATLRVPKVDGRGAAVMKAVSAQVRKTANITVKTDSKILDVYLDGDKVAGVAADIDGKKAAIKARAVVLATGGFGRNQKLIEKYTNQWKDTFRIMDVEDKGDGLLLASALGAGVANLQVAMVTPLMEYSKRIFYSSLTLLAGAILVNEEGKRFVSELIIYTTTNTEMLKQKASYQIVCEGLHPMVEEMIKNGVTTRADSIEELAQKLNVPVANIKYEIEEHNRITALPAGPDRKDRFGRTAFGKPLKAPFYFLRMHPVMIETVGGITIDEKAQVVTLAGKPVAKGFYAGGAVAFGEHFGRGYRSGDAYVYSGVFGMVAGQEAGRFAKT